MKETSQFLKQVRGDMYTLNGLSIHRNPLTLHINENDQQHIKKQSEKTFEACENSSSCTKYIITSVHIWKTTKKDNQNHVCILLHREALSVIRCVLLQAYSY